MTVAALYDIHGNLPALEAVLAEVREVGAELVIIGGDVVPGPMPAECLDLLLGLDLEVRFLSGNGERQVLAARDGVEDKSIPEPHRAIMRWVAEQLTPAHVESMRSWPATLDLQVEGVGDVLFCHATPHSDMEIFTRQTPEARLRSLFEGVKAGVVVCGHTHMPFQRSLDELELVNAGSVGMPFGPPGADWLLFQGGIEPRQTRYGLEAAASRVRDTEYPQAEEFASKNILDPPTVQDMLGVFKEPEDP